MLLPEINIPVSIDDFETNFEYFFVKYEFYEDSPKLTKSKSNFSYNGHRYSIYFEEEKPETSQQFLIGEIDAIMVHNNRTDISAAVYHVQDYKEGLRFFDKFYFMIFDKWEIEFDVLLLNCKRGEGATMEWVKTGWDTGYFSLPEVYSEMFYENDCYDEFLKFSPGDLEIYEHLSESAREDIRQKYEFGINQGLPTIPRVSENAIKGKSTDPQDDSSGRDDENKQLEIKSWKDIPDENHAKKILELWDKGYTVDKIAREIGWIKSKTVRNRLSILRIEYGSDIVPYRQKWRDVK